MNERRDPTTSTLRMPGGGRMDCATEALPRPPQPAVHCRLRDARLGRRRRRRPAGNVAAVDEGRRAEVRDQRAYLVRITTRRSLDRLRTMKRRKETTSAPGCPSRCSPRRTSPRTSSSPKVCRWPSCSSWRRWRRPSAPSSCCARSSPSTTPRSPPPSARPRRPCARSRTGPACTSMPAALARWSPRDRPVLLLHPSNARSKPGTCRVSLTCSPPRSSW